MPTGLKTSVIINAVIAITCFIFAANTQLPILYGYMLIPLVLIGLTFIKTPGTPELMRKIAYGFLFIVGFMVLWSLADSWWITFFGSRLIGIAFIVYLVGLRSYLNDDSVRQWYGA